MKTMTQEQADRIKTNAEAVVAAQNEQIDTLTAAGDLTGAQTIRDWRDSYVRATARARVGAVIVAA